jgi:GNAT superfamily N-acetyltransferase
MAHEERNGNVLVRREDLGSAVAVALIGALNAELLHTYPEEGATHFRLDPDEVAGDCGAFLVAVADGTPVGCGAIRRLDVRTAELKRMFVVPAMRGRGIGHAVLTALAAEGRRLGVDRLVLETGERQREALVLYGRAGFVRIPAFGEYVDSPLSVCMEMRL